MDIPLPLKCGPDSASLSVVAICLELRGACEGTDGFADLGTEFIFSTEGSSASLVASSSCATLIVVNSNLSVFRTWVSDYRLVS